MIYLLDDEEIEPQRTDLLKVCQFRDTDHNRLLKQCFCCHEKVPFSLIPEKRVSDTFEKATKLLDHPGTITNTALQINTCELQKVAMDQSLKVSSRNLYLLTSL